MAEDIMATVVPAIAGSSVCLVQFTLTKPTVDKYWHLILTTSVVKEKKGLQSDFCN